MSKHDKKRARVIIGGLVAGLGIGFFFLNVQLLAFLGAIMLGLGTSIALTSFLPKH